jgi:hypothetical protein
MIKNKKEESTEQPFQPYKPLCHGFCMKSHAKTRANPSLCSGTWFKG